MAERPWLTVEEVAHELGVTRQTLHRWRVYEHRGPPFHKICGRVRYRRDEFNAWVEGQRGQTT